MDINDNKAVSLRLIVHKMMAAVTSNPSRIFRSQEEMYQRTEIVEPLLE